MFNVPFSVYYVEQNLFLHCPNILMTENFLLDICSPFCIVFHWKKFFLIALLIFCQQHFSAWRLFIIYFNFLFIFEKRKFLHYTNDEYILNSQRISCTFQKSTKISVIFTKKFLPNPYCLKTFSASKTRGIYHFFHLCYMLRFCISSYSRLQHLTQCPTLLTMLVPWWSWWLCWGWCWRTGWSTWSSADTSELVIHNSIAFCYCKYCQTIVDWVSPNPWFSIQPSIKITRLK